MLSVKNYQTGVLYLNTAACIQYYSGDTRLMTKRKLKQKLRALKQKLKQRASTLLNEVYGGVRLSIWMTSAAILSISLYWGAKLSHEAWITHKVKSATVKLTGERGSGTGFALIAPSGRSVLITNAHVCRGLLQPGQRKITAQQDGHRPIKLEVLEIWTDHDLCLLEAPGYLKNNALSLSESSASSGQDLAVVGHPAGSEWPVVSRGQYLGDKVGPHPEFPVENEEDAKRCSDIGGKDEQVWIFRYCLKYIPSSFTTILIYPGNSGSPMVNFWGDVVGVVWGSHVITSHGVAVPYEMVKNFISVY